MTEIYLNDKRAYCSSGTSAKLCVENPFFTNSGSYTLDISFPLHIDANAKLFGPIHRIDVQKQQVTYDASIIADCVTIFRGVATVTTVTNDEVKLQFLGGNSKVRFWSDAEKKYIDEIQYSYSDTVKDYEGFYRTPNIYKKYILRVGSWPGVKGVLCYMPTHDEGNTEGFASATGVFNETKLLIHNDDYSEVEQGGQTVNPIYIMLSRECVHPSLVFVVKQLINKLGYTLRENQRDDVLANSIYIATAQRTNRRWYASNDYNSADENAIAKALPHWTVKEFFQEVQKFLNVTFVFDDISATCDILSDVFNNETINLSNAVEEDYETEVIDNEDAKENLADSNIVYAFGSTEYHKYDAADIEILRNFDIVECESYEDIINLISSYRGGSGNGGHTIDTSVDEKYHNIYHCPEGYFCVKGSVQTSESNNGYFGGNSTDSATVGKEEDDGSLVQVNFFGPLVRDIKNDNNVDLKISPVATTYEIEMPVFLYKEDSTVDHGEDFLQKDTGNTFKMPVLCLNNPISLTNKSSVWDAVNGNMETPDGKEDAMQVFLCDGIANTVNPYGMPVIMPYTDRRYDIPYGNEQLHSLSLSINDTSLKSVGRYHAEVIKLHKGAELKVNFIVDKIPSVFSKYYIRGKYFMCKKLEISFDENGMKKIITGYFEQLA